MLCVHSLQISEQSSCKFLRNLKVALISKVQSNVLANERTDSFYNVGGKLLGCLTKKKQTLKWRNGSELSFLVWLNISFKFNNIFKCHIKRWHLTELIFSWIACFGAVGNKEHLDVNYAISFEIHEEEILIWEKQKIKRCFYLLQVTCR